MKLRSALSAVCRQSMWKALNKEPYLFWTVTLEASRRGLETEPQAGEDVLVLSKKNFKNTSFPLRTDLQRDKWRCYLSECYWYSFCGVCKNNCTRLINYFHYSSILAFGSMRSSLGRYFSLSNVAWTNTFARVQDLCATFPLYWQRHTTGSRTFQIKWFCSPLLNTSLPSFAPF